MKPTDLRILANLLLDLQDVIKDDHHHPIHAYLLDNSVIKAYAATVELVDFVSEEIAILEKAGLLAPVTEDPEEEAAFEKVMDVIFEPERRRLKEVAKLMDIDPEREDMPRLVGKQLHKMEMDVMTQNRIERWKDQPSEL